MSYQLLSEPIRKYIREKRWDFLRPIQAAAISRIMSTDNNYILASKTASGKTEAAFLPILSKTDFNKAGVQVLYISPLIALINDQFFRIEELCKDLEIKVTKWHGEAKKSLKTNLIKEPNGIVLITPESLEAMFVNAPYNVSTLFGNLKYIVIDEIHSFLGVDRGLQLMSLLSRIQEVNKSKIITIGLSATIGDDNYIEAKRLTGDVTNTKVLLDRTKKETEAKFKYFHNSTAELSLDLLKDLYKETCSHKVLIFPNSRGRTEEVAVKLRKISDRVNGHKFYYSHHSSVDKEIRESVEHFAKNNVRFNFCISCTSTLELGIDIGTVDKIVQIDSTHSVASLVQRIGRSGRKEGEKSIVNIYATDKWSLLQSLACWLLYKVDFLEPIKTAQKPYDILLHQLLSIVKQLSGCSQIELTKRLKNNFAFHPFEEQELNSLIEDAIKSDYLEEIQRELILGIEGEKIVNIDFEGGTIIVIPARDGKKPMFFGGGGNIHPRIREEMLRILKCGETYPELDKNSNSVLNELRNDFKRFQINDFMYERPLIEKEGKLLIFTFTGSKINKSLSFLIGLTKRNISIDDHSSSLEIYMAKSELKTMIQDVNKVYHDIDNYLIPELEKNESLIGFSKWGSYLPMKYKCEIVKERYFDFEGAINLINNIELIEE